MGFILSPFGGQPVDIKKKFVDWAMESLLDFIRKNGMDLAEVFKDWLLELVQRGEDMVFNAPYPPVGCEDHCSIALASFNRLAAEDE